MQESPGRRIKRAIHIDINSIEFCTSEMLARFEKDKLHCRLYQAQADGDRTAQYKSWRFGSRHGEHSAV